MHIASVEHNSPSLAGSHFCGSKTAPVKSSVKSEKRAFPTQRLGVFSPEEDRKIMSLYTELWKNSKSDYTMPIRGGTTRIFPVDEKGCVTWVGKSNGHIGVYRTCPNQFAQYTTHFKDSLPAKTCLNCKHMWLKLWQPCFFCQINQCLDGEKCNRPLIIPPPSKHAETSSKTSTAFVNDTVVATPFVPTLTGFATKAAITAPTKAVETQVLTATECATTTVTIDSALVKKTAKRGRLAEMSKEELRSLHQTTVCLNFARFGYCTYAATKKGCAHVCQGRVMTFRKDARDAVKLLLETPDAISFSGLFTAMQEVLLKGSEQVKFIFANMLSDASISNDMKAVKRALFNGNLNEEDHMSGLFQLWSACETESHHLFKIKAKTVPKPKVAKPVNKPTEGDKVKKANEKYISHGNPMANDDDIDEEASMYIYSRDATDTPLDETTKTPVVKAKKEIIIPPPCSFSLESLVTIDSTCSVDLIAHEIARRTQMCFLGVRMDCHKYRKIYGYGKPVANPPHPVKETIVAPSQFSSEKAEKQYLKKCANATSLYAEEMTKWEKQVAFNTQKASLILPADMNSPTNLPAKQTCSGGDACRCGVHNRDEVILFTGMNNKKLESGLTAVEQKNFEANKLAAEVKRSQMENEYTRFILFDYMPVFIADQTTKKDNTLTSNQHGEYSSAHKAVWAKKTAMEEDIMAHYEGEWTKYHPIGKDLVYHYGYSAKSTPVAEIVQTPVEAPVETIVPMQAIVEAIVQIQEPIPIVVDDFYTGASRCDDDIQFGESAKEKKEREKKEKRLILEAAAAKAKAEADAVKALAKAEADAAKTEADAAKALAKAEKKAAKLAKTIA